MKWFGVQIKTPGRADYGLRYFFVECYYHGKWSQVTPKVAATGSPSDPTTTFEHDTDLINGLAKDHEFQTP